MCMGLIHRLSFLNTIFQELPLVPIPGIIFYVTNTIHMIWLYCHIVAFKSAALDDLASISSLLKIFQHFNISLQINYFTNEEGLCGDDGWK